MAINKIAAPLSNSPSVFASPVVNQLLALSMASEKHARIVNGYVRKGSMFCILGDLFVADSDTLISGTESGSVAVIFTVSGNEATAAYTTSNDATWNGAYQGYYDSSNRLYIYDYIYPADNFYGIKQQQEDDPGIDSFIGSLNTYYATGIKIVIPKSGKWRIKYSQKKVKGNGNTILTKNGVAITSAAAVTTDYATISNDIVCEEYDIVEIQYAVTAWGEGGFSPSFYALIKDLGLYSNIGVSK